MFLSLGDVSLSVSRSLVGVCLGPPETRVEVESAAGVASARKLLCFHFRLPRAVPATLLHSTRHVALHNIPLLYTCISGPPIVVIDNFRSAHDASESLRCETAAARVMTSFWQRPGDVHLLTLEWETIITVTCY